MHHLKVTVPVEGPWYRTLKEIQVKGHEPELRDQKGDFDAKFVDGKLSLREDLVRILEGRCVNGVEAMVDYLHTYPAVLANSFMPKSWTVQEVRAATEKLMTQLSGVVSPTELQRCQVAVLPKVPRNA